MIHWLTKLMQLVMIFSVFTIKSLMSGERLGLCAWATDLIWRYISQLYTLQKSGKTDQQG